jgi:hypothetical protein
MTTQNHRSPDADYLDSVINFYIQMPDTPDKPSQNDRITAADFLASGVTLKTVKDALMLASVRRRARPDDATPLPPVRSLAYFKSVILELDSAPLPDEYQLYLRDKLRRLVAK